MKDILDRMESFIKTEDNINIVVGRILDRASTLDILAIAESVLKACNDSKSLRYSDNVTELNNEIEQLKALLDSSY